MSADPSRARRWPVVIVLLVAVVVGVGVQRRRDQATHPTPAVPVDQLMPAAPGPATLSSTWYCAASTAVAAHGTAEQTLIIENAGERDVSGLVTAISDKGTSASQAIRVRAHDHLEVSVHRILTATDAAAIVEVSGGQVAVAHQLTGPDGAAVAACSTTPSDQWYLPAGTTRPGSHYWLALFNPFPSDAIADVNFVTSDGVRSPPPWNPLVVPGRDVVVLPVDQVVTLRSQMTTTVSVTTGRLVVDQLQTQDGTAGTAKGMTLTPAAPRPATSWSFADGPATPGAHTHLVVQNPGSSSARVSVQVRLDQASRNGTVSPFVSTVAPGGYWDLDVSGDPRVPKGIGYTAVATSTAGQPVVVARVVNAVPPGRPSGFSIALGSPVLARRWLVPLASSSDVQKATLVVTNPSTRASVHVTVVNVSGGGLSPLQGTEPVEVVPAGGRGGFAVAGGSGAPLLSLLVTAEAPVVVEIRLQFPDHGFAVVLAVPETSG
jgi:hypothetical protein